ncbi:MAG: cation:proton antiporter [Pseudomonadales bacterium]
MDVASAVDLLLVFFLGGALGWLSKRWRFPNAVAQVLLGVLLGGAVLGLVQHGPALHDLGQIGVVLLLGLAGLELGLDRLRAAGWAGVAVAVFGIGLSFGGGFVVAWLYGSALDASWYVGIALTATSIGISVQVLEQFGLVEHRTGEIIIAAAVIDDVLALYLLAAAHGVFGDGGNATGALLLVLEAVVALSALYWLARAATRRLNAVVSGMSHGWASGLWTVSVIFAGAVFTDALGLSAVVGAFFAGLGVGDGFGRRPREATTRGLEPLLWATMPFFFVMIGVQADWRGFTAPGVGWLLAGLLTVGLAGKSLGGLLGALGVRALRERWLIGLGMVGRGEVALVVATLGRTQGHLGHDVFVVLVSVTIVLAVLGPLLMALLARGVTTTRARAL